MMKLLKTIGIGIRSYKVAKIPWSFNVRVTYGSTTLESVSRDYVTIFFLPIVPLGLSVYGQGCYVRMDNKTASNVLSGLITMYGTPELHRQAKLIPVTRSIMLAVLVAICGTLLSSVVGYCIFGLLGFFLSLIGTGLTNFLFMRMIGPKGASSHWRK
jgi:hypothetical protein